MRQPHLGKSKLINLIGEAVINHEGERIGFVVGVLNVAEDTSNQNIPEYIIVRNDSINKNSTKYYAVPALTKLIDLADPDSFITANFTKQNLMRAKRISIEKCPKPFEYEPLIYELTDYGVNQKEDTGC